MDKLPTYEHEALAIEVVSLAEGDEVFQSEVFKDTVAAVADIH